MHVSRCGTAFHSPRHGTRSETPEARAPRGRLRANIICSSRRRISSSDSHHRRWGDRGDRRGQDGKEKQFPGVGRLLHVRRLPERDEIEGPIHPGRGLVSRDRECGHLIFDHVVDATVGFEGGATRNGADVSCAVTGGVEAECWPARACVSVTRGEQSSGVPTCWWLGLGVVRWMLIQSTRTKHPPTMADRFVVAEVSLPDRSQANDDDHVIWLLPLPPPPP